ncbi:unnamed protein product, partial [Amoebophrya sp. A25]|eukprot:GSA25T00020589001.1
MALITISTLCDDSGVDGSMLIYLCFSDSEKKLLYFYLLNTLQHRWSSFLPECYPPPTHRHQCALLATNSYAGTDHPIRR